MRIYFDTEFIEDGKTLDLISIGLVREDGKTYYAESEEADLTKADQWIRDNVLVSLTGETKPRAVIAEEIKAFAGEDAEFWAYYAAYDWVGLCQLYGRMMDIPEGWSRFCRDLKQKAMEKGIRTPQDDGIHNALGDAIWAKETYEMLEKL